MPNWCENTLKITGPRRQLREFKEEAAHYKKEFKDENDSETALSLNKIVPMPAELEKTTSPSDAKTEEEKKRSEELISKYGADNWYDWKVKNWGTKWDVTASLVEQDEGKLVYYFDTAWSPPIEWLVNASKKYDKLIFWIEFEEPGMGFAGETEVKAGEILSDNTYDVEYDEDGERID